MDFGKAFSFVFDDEEWIQKILVGGLISLIPVVGQFVVVGWGFEVTKRVIEGSPEPLPDWSEFGEYLVNGFLVAVVGFVYSLPLILISGCSFSVFPFLGNGSEDAVAAFVSIVAVCISCFSGLYGILLGLVLPAAVGNYAAEGEFGAAFRFGKVFKLVRNNVGPYVIVLLGSLLSGLVASLGTIACVIGVLFTSAYALLVNGHLTGQAYLKAGSPAAAVEEGEVPEEDL